MENLYQWIHWHCWRCVAGAWVLGCLLLFVVEIVPRCSMLITSFHALRSTNAERLKINDWEARSLQLTNASKVLEERVKALYISVPGNDQTSLILNYLQEKSQEKAITLQQIKTGPPALSGAYQALPISVIAEGDFHTIGAFIDAFEQSPYLIKVVSLQIKREGRLNAPLIAALQLNAVVVDR